MLLLYVFLFVVLSRVSLAEEKHTMGRNCTEYYYVPLDGRTIAKNKYLSQTQRCLAVFFIHKKDWIIV